MDPVWCTPSRTERTKLKVGDKFIVEELLMDWHGMVNWVMVKFLNGTTDLLPVYFFETHYFCPSS